jgi:transcriptional regulator with XRE-family HTH domain
MATDAEWRARIGARLQELRNLRGWSLTTLARQTGDRLNKSAISNYEQGTRMPGPEEATALAEALGESPAHILCLDDDMPALSKTEAQLIHDLRALPENEREEYAERISSLAKIYKKPVPDERLMRTAYNPGKRPKTADLKAAAKPIKRHDQ